jgi:hypothetical protein
MMIAIIIAKSTADGAIEEAHRVPAWGKKNSQPLIPILCPSDSVLLLFVFGIASAEKTIEERTEHVRSMSC